ncbi:MAG: hypothetical protein WDN66_05485 [Candidatus Saccharibacteria bacterium]
MRAINHSLTGALIGLTISEPLIAAPLALASHYVMDVIPHHGFNRRGNAKITNRYFIASLYIDAVLCLALVLVLIFSRPINWLLAIVCAFIAAAPDFLSINRFAKSLKKKSWKPNLYSKFASSIQWFERPIGAVVEATWFVAMIICVSIFVRH